MAGGKGGTGKTFVAANLAYKALLEGRSVVLADIDVENPSTRFLLRVEVERVEEFKVFVPMVDEHSCRRCGACVQHCPEHALVMLPEQPPRVLEDLCSGCGVCRLVCPYSAVKQGYRVEGRVEWGFFEGSGRIVVGELRPGSKRSVVMVVWMVERILAPLSGFDLMIMDCPAGAGGAHVAALRRSAALIAVTEPTPLGLSDLKKFLALSARYVKPSNTIVVVNKSGISPRIESEVVKVAREFGAELVRIPFSEEVAKSYAAGRPVLELYPNSPASKALKELYEVIEGVYSSSRSPPTDTQMDLPSSSD